MTANSLNSVPQIHHTKDYLGNIRNVLAKKDGVVQEVQHTAYYPFGGIIADLSSDRGVQNRFYNGKELDYANNLYWYDYGARQYDPTRGQFTTPDPLAEKYYGWNIYGYCMSNPAKYIDPDGMKVQIPVSKDKVKVLSYINEISTTKFNCDEKGFLVADGQNDTKGKSESYAQRIKEAIGSENSITIFIDDVVFEKGKELPVSMLGEGLTQEAEVDCVSVTISGKDHTIKKESLKQTPAEILMHELVGHTIPRVAPNEKFDTGNAIDNENKIRRELKIEEREKDPKHTE